MHNNFQTQNKVSRSNNLITIYGRCMQLCFFSVGWGELKEQATPRLFLSKEFTYLDC